ncbi:class I lanthipeptide [Sphingobacterium sp.]|uniref:class I lanthipeptide n=1 Tax=Sphingobacterium sp. TaxID=341027 RepID=UPI0031DC1613
MKKRKLNLDKRAIARLSNESLENIQGGAEGWTSSCICSVANCNNNCTNVNTTTKKTEEDATAALAAASCT